MDNKIKQINKRIESVIVVTLEIFLAFIRALIIVTLLAGAFASFLLLYKLYPRLFGEFVLIVAPVTVLILQILKFVAGVGIGLCIGYELFNLIIFMHNDIQKAKKRRDGKREKFLDDLADKIIKRGKNKR